MDNGFENNAEGAYIPRSYFILYPKDAAFDRREITVRRFSTGIPFNRDQVLQALKRSHLTKGRDFGVIQIYKEQSNEDIRVLCGLTGVRSFTLIGEQDELKRMGIKHIVVATLMVEFLPNESSGGLDLLIYGGPQGQQNLWDMLQNNIKAMDEPTPRYLTAQGIRNLCEEFFEQLYEIVTDPGTHDGYGNIIEADLKANKREYINHNSDRMQQIHGNKGIKIRAFRSIIMHQSISSLRRKYDVKFKVLKDSGIRLEMPELQVKKKTDDVLYEIVLYDFARSVYAQIVKDKDLYEEIGDYQEDMSPIQLDLFS